MSDRFTSLKDFASSFTPVVRAHDEGRFSHYVKRDLLKSYADRLTAPALCGKIPVNPWNLQSTSRICQTCHSRAGKCIVADPPFLQKPMTSYSTGGVSGAAPYGGGQHAWNGPPLQLASRYPGNCVACRKPYIVGDQIYYKKGGGCRHLDCGPHP